MTEETPLEKLKKASASAKSALEAPAASTAAAPALSEDELRKKAYDDAMGGTIFNKDKVEDIAKGLSEDFNETAKFTKGVYQGAKWTYDHILRPVGRGLLWPVMKFGGKSYMKMFNAISYKKDENGEEHLSKKRAAGVIACTLAAAMAATPVAGELAWSGFSAAWWLTTRQTETLYLHNATPTGTNQFIVVGCDEFPCSDSNSVSFKVDDSWFHDARHFILHGTPFRPDAVAAAVPPVVNKCEVTYYGWRWRPISRTMDLWPRMLEASCVPINMNDGSPVKTIDGMPTTNGQATAPANVPAKVPAP